MEIFCSVVGNFLESSWGFSESSGNNSTFSHFKMEQDMLPTPIPPIELRKHFDAFVNSASSVEEAEEQWKDFVLQYNRSYVLQPGPFSTYYEAYQFKMKMLLKTKAKKRVRKVIKPRNTKRRKT